MGAPVNVPVDVTTAVPVKFAVLLFASSAVMSALNAVLAVCCGSAAANRGDREVRDHPQQQ